METYEKSKIFQKKMQEFDLIMDEAGSHMNKDSRIIVAIPSPRLANDLHPRDSEQYKEAELFVKYVKQKLGVDQVLILSECLSVNLVVHQAKGLDYIFFLHPFEDYEYDYIIESILKRGIGFSASKLYEAEENVA